MTVSSLCLVLLIYYNIESYKNQSYKGYRVYNVKNEVAIAYIYNRKVHLFSSLDSLNHSTLKYHVFPDLLSYVNIDEVNFQHLMLANKDNVEIQVGNKHFLLLQSMVQSITKKYDIVICRRNNSFIAGETVNSEVLIFDGSNSDKFIQEYSKPNFLKSITPYVLKNNFAYVWDEN